MIVKDPVVRQGQPIATYQ